MEDNKLDIVPGIGIYSVLSKLNYTAWNALAEYIDNSIQSFEDNTDLLLKNNNEYKLIIEVFFNKDSIIIKDNSTGISINDIDRAFKIAAIPPNTSGKNEYGMGMKSASCWFAPKWSVVTKHINENIERTVEFDIKKITAEKTTFLDFTTQVVNNDQHYTIIKLSDVEKMPHGNTKHKIKNHLTDIYRKYLRDGTVIIYIDREKLIYENLPILNAEKFYDDTDNTEYNWEKKINFNINNIEVNGTVGLMDPGSRSKSGFALFRRGRIIIGSGDKGYKPHLIFGASNSFQSLRLFGELNLDNIEVSHTKDGFKWDEIEEQFIEKLKDKLDEGDIRILEQSKKFRKNEKNEINTIIEGATKELEDELNKKEIKEKLGDDNKPNIENELEETELYYKKIIKLEINERIWEITIEFTENDETIDDIFNYKNFDIDDNSAKITFRIPINHPFITKYMKIKDDSFDVILKIITSLILARNNLELAGADIDDIDIFLFKFNEIINSLSIEYDQV